MKDKLHIVLHGLVASYARPVKFDELAAQYPENMRRQVANRLSELAMGRWPALRLMKLKRGVYMAEEQPAAIVSRVNARTLAMFGHRHITFNKQMTLCGAVMENDEWWQELDKGTQSNCNNCVDIFKNRKVDKS